MHCDVDESAHKLVRNGMQMEVERWWQKTRKEEVKWQNRNTQWASQHFGSGSDAEGSDLSPIASDPSSSNIRPCTFVSSGVRENSLQRLEKALRDFHRQCCKRRSRLQRSCFATMVH